MIPLVKTWQFLRNAFAFVAERPLKKVRTEFPLIILHLHHHMLIPRQQKTEIRIDGLSESSMIIV